MTLETFDNNEAASSVRTKINTAIEQVNTNTDDIDGKADLAVENQPLTGGVAVTSKSLGTVTTGTLTLDMGARPLQHYTNGGAHTLAPGTVNGSALIDITNDGSAGAITTSGWTMASGDAFTTTNGHKFRCHASVGTGGSLLIVEALQ
jgi:FlaG/FlaF family flagellin (archaellin)